MRSRFIIVSLLMIVLAAGSACARASAPSTTPGRAGSVAPSAPAPPIAAPAPSAGGAQPGAAGKAASGNAQDTSLVNMVVRTASITISVQDVSAAADKVKAIGESLDGYLVSSTLGGKGAEGKATVTIRVPLESYDEAMKRVRALAVEVLSGNTQTKDVTQDYVDLQSRLKNLQATEQQYLTILQKANTVDEVLKVQQQLSNVRGDIEKTKGTMQYLERTSSTSLIEVNLQKVVEFKAGFTASSIQVGEGEDVDFTDQTAGGQAPFGYMWDFGDKTSSTERQPTHSYLSAGVYSVSLKVTDAKGNTSQEAKSNYIKVLSPPGWTPGATAKAAWNGLAIFSRGLGNFAIWIGIFSPIWLASGAIYWGIRRWRRRVRRGSKV